MAIKNITNTEISATAFTWNGDTVATQTWVIANVGTPTLDAVTTAGNTTTNNIGVGLIELGGDTEHRLYRTTTSLIKGTTTDTTVLMGRTLDLFAYDDVNIRAGSGDNISFTAGGVSNAMYINSSGNVGIGTTSPASKLDVVSSAYNVMRIKRSSAGGGAGLYLENGNNNTWIIGNGGNDHFAINKSTSNFGDQFIIQSTGEVGIGTTSPTQKLHVEGGAVHVTGGTNNGKYISLFVNDSWGYLQTDAPKFYLNQELRVDTGLIGSYNEDLQLRTSAITRMTINNTTGNVGIGTSSPAEILHIGSGTVPAATLDGVLLTLGGGQYYQASDGTKTIFMGVDSSSYGIVGTLTNHDLGFRTDNAIRMLINTSGNVGIGTTSPAYKLDIAGDVFTNTKYVSDTGELLSLYQSNWNVGNRDHYIIYNGWRSNTGDYLMMKGGGNQSTLNGAIIASDGNNGRTYFGRHANQSQANDDAITPLDETYAFIGASATYFSSNVGIGTTSPSYKLDVYGSARIGGSNGDVDLVIEADADNSGENDNPRIVLKQDGGLVNGFIGLNGDADNQLAGFASNSMYIRNTGYPVHIAAGTTLGLTVLDSGNVLMPNGNVGIGTTSPSGKLHIQTDASSEFIFTGASTSGYATTFHMDNTGLDIGHNSTSRALNLKTGSLDRLTILGNGNVGIGTTSPGYTLDVNGSMHSTNITIADAVYHEGDTNTFISFSTDTINLNTGGGTRAIINNSGTKFNNDVVVAGGATLSLGERAEPDDLGRTVLIEGAANASNGEGAGRIFFTEHNSTTAAADSYGLSLYYEGDPNIALPSGFQPNQGNATWSLRRHDNSVNGVPIMSGSRTNSNVQFGGSITIGSGVTLSESTDRADLLSINSSTGGWGGLQITNNNGDGIWSFMVDGSAAGIYDDQNNDWAVYCVENSYVELRHNGSGKLATTSTGVDITGDLVASGDITAFSDADLKENVETVSDALDKVKGMRGVTFNKIGEEKRSVGVIAQELLEVLPEAVRKSGEHYSVAYGNIVGVLIEAMKEQQAQIDELKAMINGSTK